MIRLRRAWSVGILSAALLDPCSARAATSLPATWEYGQELSLPNPGLVELRIPLEALDRALPGREDLRIFDGAGREVPFAVRDPAGTAAGSGAPVPAEEIILQTTPLATVGVYRTRTPGVVETVVVRTPARDFVKPVTLEASADRVGWRLLAERFPIFRQSDGAERLEVRVPPGRYAFLRITLADGAERAIPLTGLATNPPAPEPPELELLRVTPAAVSSAEGVTRLLLRLPARHLTLHRLSLHPEDAVFSREVQIKVRVNVEGEVREQTMARGRIHRIALDGEERREVISLPLPGRPLAGRSLVVSIEDGDSPPLALRQSVEIALLPVAVRFLARAGERYTLGFGNRSARPPRYDLAALAERGHRPAARARAGPLVRNPDYREAEAAVGAPPAGRAIDPGRWRHSRRVLLEDAGVFALDLPPEVLSQTPLLADLRLASGGRQVPYILEPNGPEQEVAVPLEALAPAGGGRISRWRLAFPHPGLPLRQLSCTVEEPVFRRSVVLFDEAAPERFGRRFIVGGAWERRGAENRAGRFSLSLHTRIQGNALLLEIDDGENLPLTLRQCTLAWRSSRLLFKGAEDQEIVLLYGNAAAGAPRYDLALLAEELLAADARPATLAPAAAPARGSGYSLPPGWRRFAFWGGLVLVVAVLIAVIARLLPSPEGRDAD